MKNRRLISLVVLLVTAVVIFCVFLTFKRAYVIRDDPGKIKTPPEITFVGNNIVKITLAENPATGYTWHYIIENGNVAEVTHDEFISPNKNAIVGASGIHTWEIKAKNEGTTLIRFNNYREWEGIGKSVKSKVYGINVDSDGKIYIKEG
jgi:predicted secreted protein